jgi:polyisoprenoid-binding protein YceI
LGASPGESTDLPTAGAPETTKLRYVVDPKGSTFEARAFATGLLSSLGHNPTIAISDFEGEVQFASSALEDASVRLVIRAASLTVTGDISAKDRQEIERRMHDEVLETDGFEEIVYECNRVSPIQKISEGLYSVTLNGELSLHGVTNAQPVSARVTIKGETLRAAGDFSIQQSAYDIRPVSAAGGTVKLKDELKLSFDIVARKI